MNRPKFLALASALLLAFTLTGPAMAQPCVPFFDMLHCPLGSADLGVSRDGQSLEASGLGPQGEDGVASHFEPSTFWNGQTRFLGEPNGAPSVHLSAVSGGTVTSQMSLDTDGDVYYLNASFTGQAENSTYSMLVYREGVLQGAAGGIPSASSAASAKARTAPAAGPFSSAPQTLCSDCQPDLSAIIAALDAAMLEWLAWIDSFGWGFGIQNNGGCTWGASLPAAARVTLPDGNEYIGDEIRLVEEVPASGHYPYVSFESIETRTSAESVSFIEQSTIGLR